MRVNEFFKVYEFRTSIDSSLVQGDLAAKIELCKSQVFQDCLENFSCLKLNVKFSQCASST